MEFARKVEAFHQALVQRADSGLSLYDGGVLGVARRLGMTGDETVEVLDAGIRSGLFDLVPLGGEKVGPYGITGFELQDLLGGVFHFPIGQSGGQRPIPVLDRRCSSVACEAKAAGIANRWHAMVGQCPPCGEFAIVIMTFGHLIGAQTKCNKLSVGCPHCGWAEMQSRGSARTLLSNFLGNGPAFPNSGGE